MVSCERHAMVPLVYAHQRSGRTLIDVVKMEIATLIVAVIGGITGLVNTFAIILVNGKVDRLTGRVDVLQEAVMKRS